MIKDMNKLRVKRLQEVLDKSGLTYVELEKKTGISKSSLQRYATGDTKKLTIDIVEKIASALGVDPRYILGWDDDVAQYKMPTSKKKGIPVTFEPVGEGVVAMRHVEPEKEKSPFPIKMTEKELVERISNLGNKDLYDLYTFLDYLDFRSGDKEKDHP